MIVELKRGYTIESNYDKFTDSYITRLLDNEGNQVRDALYSSDMIDRNYDVQEIKDFFNEYIDLKNKTGNIENEESTEIEVEDDNIEESLDTDIKKKAIKTKKATKKTKLPALSTLSPIMPDGAAGIATFNSGIGLSEEWLSREELINKIKNLGFRNYKFDKYTDEQLYRIYHERLNAVNKRKQERRDIEQAILDKANADYELAEREREVSKDQGSFFKDGIEFESEEAAKEYFGENMDNKIYLNDMHEAWDIEEEPLRIECIDGQWNVRSNSGWDTYYFGDSKEDCQNWCVGNDYQYYIEENLNESLNSKKEIKTKSLRESLKDLDRKAFDIECRDTSLEMLYESMRDKLSSDDIKKLGSFLTRAETADEVATYMRGLLSEDLSNERKGDIRNLYDDIYYNDIIGLFDVSTDEESGINPDPYDDNKFTLTFHVRGDLENYNSTIDRVKHRVTEYNMDLLDSDFEAISRPDGSTYAEGYLFFKIRVNDPIFKDLSDHNRLVDIAQEIENAAQDDGVWCTIYATSPGSIAFLVEGDWKWGHLRFEHIAGAILQSHDLNYESFEDEVDDSDTDDYEAIHTFNIYKSPMDESLNEAWNRTESDYGRTIYYNRDWYKDDKDFFDSDEVVYIQPSNGKFTAILSKSGNYGAKQKSFNSFEEASRFADYLYKKYVENDSSLNEDYISNIEDATKDLIEKLNEVGFILDESVTPIKDNMFGGKHLQVINPSLVFPIEEAEGDEELAYQLMVDDLKEVTGVLDDFDEALGNSGYITFNFGPNKDDVITGGIDLRFKRR